MSRIFALVLFHIFAISFASVSYAENLCSQGVDCYSQPLGQDVCIGANGFLQQVNILSLINKADSPLIAQLKYRNAEGILQGETNVRVQPQLKQDIIINELGLLDDSIGTICISTQAEIGSWHGGMTIYKVRQNEGFGTNFDFALYYPLLNPTVESTTTSLNTFHLGVPSENTVANWISISDAQADDGHGISGRLDYFDAQGRFTGAQSVTIADGGRMDFDAHRVLSGPSNIDAIGSARFSPNLLGNGNQAQFNFTTTRYFYDCPAQTCSNFRTAFVVPRAGTQNVQMFGKLSDAKGEASVIELVNSSLDPANYSLFVQNALGTQTDSFNSSISNLSSRHLLFNEQALGTLSLNSGDAGALTVFYKLDDFGHLLNAHASPLLNTSSSVLYSQYNSFLEATNTGELFNSGDETAQVSIRAISYNGQLVLDDILDVQAGQRIRFVLPLPSNSYGTIRVESENPAVQFLNTLTRDDDYTLQYPGL